MKACTRCGGDAQVGVDENRWRWVECSTCGTRPPECGSGPKPVGAYATADDARRAWDLMMKGTLEPKVVRREHKIDERHCLVFEAKKRGATWEHRCVLMARLSGMELMASKPVLSGSADSVASFECEWVERFKGMGR